MTMITFCEDREFSVEFIGRKAEEIIARRVTKYLKCFVFPDFCETFHMSSQVALLRPRAAWTIKSNAKIKAVGLGGFDNSLPEHLDRDNYFDFSMNGDEIKTGIVIKVRL
ncbi:MAG: hypothetical protein NVV73_00505 [Cellvibrionaceae bacterium]|nr:hypothetical protein [Cellvibrionaceae bacterium]